MVIVSCEKRQALPIEDFYAFAKIRTIVVTPNVTDYALFISKPVEVSINSLDEKGIKLSIPDSLLQLSVNGIATKTRIFTPTDTGKYIIKAKFGSVESAAVTVIAKDIVKNITVSLSKPSFYLREETTPVGISATIYDNENHSYPLKDSTQLKIFIDNQPLNAWGFLPNQARAYQVKVKLANHESPVTNLQALDQNAVTRYVKLESSNLGGTNLGAEENKSSFDLKTTIYDKDMKVLPLSEEIKFYANASPLNTNTFTANNEGTFQITASGYGTTSNPVEIKIRPKATYPITKIPLILHLINQPVPSETDLAQDLEIINRAFRNKYPTPDPKDPNAVDLLIEFEWATKSPDGELLDRPGIHVVNGPKTQYTDAELLDNNGICGANFWNPNQYINVWVADAIDVPWAGKASLPILSDYPSSAAPLAY